MAVSSAGQATRDLNKALKGAQMRHLVTDFWTRTWDQGDVRTIVVIPDPTDLEMLAKVREVCEAAFPDIFRAYEIHPDTRRPWTNYNRKLAFGFHRPLEKVMQDERQFLSEATAALEAMAYDGIRIGGDRLEQYVRAVITEYDRRGTIVTAANALVEGLEYHRDTLDDLDDWLETLLNNLTKAAGPAR